MKAEQARIEGLRKESNKVEIVVPVSVANNLDRINKVTEIVLGELGCGRCHSGFDLRYITESRFRFNEKLEQIDVGGYRG